MSPCCSTRQMWQRKRCVDHLADAPTIIAAARGPAHAASRGIPCGVSPIWATVRLALAAEVPRAWIVTGAGAGGGDSGAIEFPHCGHWSTFAPAVRRRLGLLLICSASRIRRENVALRVDLNETRRSTYGTARVWSPAALLRRR